MVLPLAIQEHSKNILYHPDESRHLECYIEPFHCSVGYAVSNCAKILNAQEL